VDPRDALAQLGRVSFEDTSMEELLQRVAELSKQVMPGVAEASVTLIADDRPMTAAFTGELALTLDESQIGHGYGPCLDAAVGQEIVEITDARTETRWPDYTPVCIEQGALSSLSMPVPVREDMHAALNLYGRPANAFDDTSRETGREFASYVAVAVRNMHLYETTREWANHLDAAMRSRAVIEQAKGILMSQRRCDAQEAFSLLAAASQRSNRKLRDIAQSLVDGVSGRDPRQD
jgi:GAF domain-containing protein